MTVEYLKRASKTAASEAQNVGEIVQPILDAIEAGGEDVAKEYAAKFDQYEGTLLLTEEDIAAASAKVPQKLATSCLSSRRCTTGRVRTLSTVRRAAGLCAGEGL